MPCPFTSPKMFWAGPNFLCKIENLFIYYGTHKHAREKDDLISVKLVFVTQHKSFWRKKGVKFLGWLKKFGPAQNSLGPVKVQGIWVGLWFKTRFTFVKIAEDLTILQEYKPHFGFENWWKLCKREIRILWRAFKNQAQLQKKNVQISW